VAAILLEHLFIFFKKPTCHQFVFFHILLVQNSSIRRNLL
jgi:hypothetical protein